MPLLEIDDIWTMDKLISKEILEIFPKITLNTLYRIREHVTGVLTFPDDNLFLPVLLFGVSRCHSTLLRL